ncbi:MAG: hypothetical protein U1F47_14590 [Hyphomicrobiales bacterium]
MSSAAHELSGLNVRGAGRLQVTWRWLARFFAEAKVRRRDRVAIDHLCSLDGHLLSDMGVDMAELGRVVPTLRKASSDNG